MSWERRYIEGKELLQDLCKGKTFQDICIDHDKDRDSAIIRIGSCCLVHLIEGTPGPNMDKVIISSRGLPNCVANSGPVNNILRQDKALDLYLAGHSIKDIMHKFNIAKNSGIVCLFIYKAAIRRLKEWQERAKKSV